MWTRSKSKEAKEVPKFKELGTPKRKTLIKSRSLSNINALKSSFKLVPSSLPNTTIAPKMANLVPNIYPAWNDGVPLALAILHDIPANVFKILSYFDVTTKRTTYEHYVDVFGLAKTHNIQHEDIMVRIVIQRQGS